MDYDPIDPTTLDSNSPAQKLALALGWAPSTIAAWRKNGIPTPVNNALRHILYLKAELAHKTTFNGGDRD